MPPATYFTADHVRAIPHDGKRYETVHGELLVTPAPAPMHQVALSELSGALFQYLKANGIRGPWTSPADISWADDTLVQPDLFVADIDAALRSRDWRDVTAIHLVIEILSPSSLRADRFTKRRLYQEQRIPLYWVVDTEHCQVEVWTPDTLFPTVEREQLRWRHPALAAECIIELGEIFRTS